VAAVTVFVDDAVLGRLPPICVKDGVATSDRLTLVQDVTGSAGLGVAWLLILASPLGWIGLFMLSGARGGGDYLTVSVPYSEVAYNRVRRATAARLRAGLILAGALVAAVLCLLLRTTDFRLLAAGLAVVACAALVNVIVASVHLHRMAVHLDLDASRRWVTLRGVHPSFADAVRERNDEESRHLA
jgi:hypothetical protein